MDASTCSTALSTASPSINIADNTACSASSEYGGRRSRNGSRAGAASVEYSACELDIFPGGSLPGWITEERCWVISHDQRNAVVAMDLTSQFTDRQLRVEQRLRGERPKSEDNSRTDQFDLPNQVRTARLDFFRQ